MYAVFTPEDSKQYFGDNTCEDFVCELPEPISGLEYTVALYDVYITPPAGSIFILTSDILEDQGVLNGKQVPILGCFQSPGRIPTPQYLELKKESIQRIRFQLSHELPRNCRTIKIILHFKKNA